MKINTELVFGFFAFYFIDVKGTKARMFYYTILIQMYANHGSGYAKFSTAK